MSIIFNKETIKYVEQVEKSLSKSYSVIESIAFENFNRVLSAFQKNKVAARHFFGTTGYGYDDIGRQALCDVYADVFESESALVSPNITSGTQAISLALFGVLRPGQTLLSVSGQPYDTLHSVISGNGNGSLKDFGVSFESIELKDNDFDYNQISKYVKNKQPRVIFVQRSRGYSWKSPLSIDQIKKLVLFMKSISKDIVIVVDNCYGEFVAMHEPCSVGCDLAIGSLIKNPGGGIAHTGGYIAGKKELIELVSNRLTSPSTGNEIGSYLSGYLPYFMGLFQAPHIVSQAVKGTMLFSAAFSKLGFNTLPVKNEIPLDIICSIKFDFKDQLIKFCQQIQQCSPVDSFVLPIPWAMPGYDCDVIMAAGTFIQGSSLELSCDSPIKVPYIAYLQGGLNIEHIKTTLCSVIEKFKLLEH